MLRASDSCTADNGVPLQSGDGEERHPFFARLPADFVLSGRPFTGFILKSIKIRKIFSGKKFEIGYN
jgi:hypothetical protein